MVQRNVQTKKERRVQRRQGKDTVPSSAELDELWEPGKVVSVGDMVEFIRVERPDRSPKAKLVRIVRGVDDPDEEDQRPSGKGMLVVRRGVAGVLCGERARERRPVAAVGVRHHAMRHAQPVVVGVADATAAVRASDHSPSPPPVFPTATPPAARAAGCGAAPTADDTFQELASYYAYGGL
eukprot:gene54266-8562_t